MTSFVNEIVTGEHVDSKSEPTDGFNRGECMVFWVHRTL